MDLVHAPQEDFSTPGYLWTYLTFYACGATLVSSWTCFVLSIDAFVAMYPDGMVGFVFPVVNMSALLVVTLFMLVTGRQLPLNRRMFGGFFFLLVSILVVPLLQLVPGIDTHVRYVGTLVMVILTSMASAFIQSSVYGLGAVFGPDFLQAIDGGKGTGAVVLVAARIATKWAFDQDAPGMLSMGIFFALAFVTISIALALYLVLPTNPFAQPKLEMYLSIQYMTPLALPLPSPIRSPSKARPLSPTESTPMLVMSPKNESGAADMGSILTVLRQTWKPVGMCFFTFSVCLACYPGLTTSIQSASMGATWFPVVLTAAYTLADLVGKSLPMYIRLLTIENLHYPIVLQLLFVPLFLTDVLHPFLFPDVVAIALVAALGLVTGYVGTSSMILAPTTCSEVEHELAGITGSLAIITGLFSGSYLGLVLKFFVQATMST
ncbi:Aste57867_8328 [Aphanomyces stellatus]|uniref:Aste57867_8328 protein n=1 Tax=Aphanomyces stellatus TaxID=120398 RepID=A0A485KK02_9STRA|nr:hypothetical protein As57867_008296 [Aphanomyces stellatus]VFT85215.1 Aste57867_8328 [Aphanomyces stellatus]